MLLVPDMDQNLLSLGQMMEHGYVLVFGDNYCTIYDKDNRNQVVENIKMLKNRSFPLNLSYARDIALKVDVIGDSWLWHRRLGHLNFASLKTLQHRNMVYGLPSIQEMKEVCEGCALGKHHRESFPKENAWRAKVPLELVHTDVCGSMTTPTHAGNLRFLIFVDDFICMTWIPKFSQSLKDFRDMLKGKVVTKLRC